MSRGVGGWVWLLVFGLAWGVSFRFAPELEPGKDRQAFISAAMAGWFFLSVPIVYYHGRLILSGLYRRNLNPPWLLSVGIFLSWLGGGVIVRGWYTAFFTADQFGYDVGWMGQHITVLLGVFVILVGGHIHLHALLANREDNKYAPWFWSISVMLVVLAHYTVTVY